MSGPVVFLAGRRLLGLCDCGVPTKKAIIALGSVGKGPCRGAIRRTKTLTGAHSLFYFYYFASLQCSSVTGIG